jgi:hypothetical protein
LNGFPYRCPRLEVEEATSDPFTNEVDSNPNAYSAIAFSNRFDLVDDAKIRPTVGSTASFLPEIPESLIPSIGT